MLKAWLAKVRGAIRRSASFAVVVGVLAGLVILGTGAYIMAWFTPPPVPQAIVYFYDLNTQAVFVGDMSNIPPFFAPSQKWTSSAKPMGVRAAVFSCGGCARAEDRFVGYVEAYTPDARAALIERMKGPGINEDLGPDARRNDPSVAGLVVSLPDGGRWVSTRDDEAGAAVIMGAPQARCGEGKPMARCFPNAE